LKFEHKSVIDPELKFAFATPEPQKKFDLSFQFLSAVSVDQSVKRCSLAIQAIGFSVLAAWGMTVIFE